jgi:hypothetical protein
MKNKINLLSIVSIIFELLIAIVLIVEIFKEDFNWNIVWVFIGLNWISEGITKYRFGKPINIQTKYSRWLTIFLGIVMFTVNTVIVLSNY